MRKLLALLFILSGSLGISAQEIIPSDNFANTNEQKEVKKSKYNRKFNFGFKAGFNSSTYFVSNLKFADLETDNYHYNYKTGYSFSGFMRYNMGKHFIQHELTYTVSDGEVYFGQIKQDDAETTEQTEPLKPAAIKTHLQSFESPILYGYNFIKEGPYGMSFIVGPSFKLIWNDEDKIEFNNFPYDNISEELYPFTMSLVGGIGVNISNVFFDFRYELGILNISKGITYQVEGKTVHDHIYRRHNLISFSVGIIL